VKIIGEIPAQVKSLKPYILILAYMLGLQTGATLADDQRFILQNAPKLIDVFFDVIRIIFQGNDQFGLQAHF